MYHCININKPHTLNYKPLRYHKPIQTSITSYYTQHYISKLLHSKPQIP